MDRFEVDGLHLGITTYNRLSSSAPAHLSHLVFIKLLTSLSCHCVKNIILACMWTKNFPIWRTSVSWDRVIALKNTVLACLWVKNFPIWRLQKVGIPPKVICSWFLRELSKCASPWLHALFYSNFRWVYFSESDFLKVFKRTSRVLKPYFTL